ncbi:MAG: signal peptidase I [Cellulosilyticaceae bacterium]
MEKTLRRTIHILEFVKDPLLAVLAALLITNFLVVHTQIPTGSMIPTINKGDHMLINRLPFYYRDPARGEVIIFKQDGINLVKRVIGLPGDEITLVDGFVYINGEKLDERGYLESDVYSYPLMSDVIYPYIVPEDHYFVMGDNRGNSQDSRYFSAIPRSDIFAKGGLKIWPIADIGIVK